MSVTNDTAIRKFAKDVKEGLNKSPKQLSSKYFYDQKGDELFQQIMAMPDYYLTNAETEIFETYAQDWSEDWKSQHFNLIELGAGDGTKTKILLKALLKSGADFTYCPIDISRNVLTQLRNSLNQELPDLKIKMQAGDYFQALDYLNQKLDDSPKIFLFLGSNIGNFTKTEAKAFLQQLKSKAKPGDRILVGIDLKKDPQQILDAYNDNTGITAAFNLNLLRRMNRELGANFDLSQFKHWETYHPISGETESFLISKTTQTVSIPEIQSEIHFQAWEPIKVELSQKYSLFEIESLFEKIDLKKCNHYLDKDAMFVDTVWEVY